MRHFLTFRRRPVHDLVLDDRLALVVLVRSRAGRLPSDYGHLHVLDLDSHQQEINLHPKRSSIFAAVACMCAGIIISTLFASTTRWGAGGG